MSNVSVKRRAFSAAVVFLLLSALFAADSAVSVYVTPKGKKYHFASCRTLKNSSSVIELSIEDAKARGYEPCGVCKSALLERRYEAQKKAAAEQ